MIQLLTLWTSALVLSLLRLKSPDADVVLSTSSSWLGIGYSRASTRGSDLCLQMRIMSVVEMLAEVVVGILQPNERMQLTWLIGAPNQLGRLAVVPSGDCESLAPSRS